MVGSDVDEYDFLSNDESQYLQYLEDQEKEYSAASQSRGQRRLGERGGHSKRSAAKSSSRAGTPGGRGTQSRNQRRVAEYDDIEGDSPDRGTIGPEDILVHTKKKKVQLDSRIPSGAKLRQQDLGRKPSFLEKSSGVGPMFGSDSEVEAEEWTDSVR